MEKEEREAVLNEEYFLLQQIQELDRARFQLLKVRVKFQERLEELQGKK